jgi:hypothetical protein
MKATPSNRSAGAAARSLQWQRGFAALALAAGLVAAPLFARSAAAQRPATVQASAYVIDSYIATALRAESAPTPAASAQSPALQPTRQVRIAGLGVLDVRSGSATEVSVVSRVADERGTAGRTIHVSVTYLGN